MNVLIGAVVVGVAAALSIVAMLAVRRRAPDGGYFADGDRAAGVFGVLATGFSVLLGFLIFLAFESYDAARVGAETEALLVAQQIETAQLLQADLRDELASGLVCYARYVIAGEWDDHEPGEQINPWGVALFRATEQMAPASATEEAAYAKWLDQTSTREEARRDRIHGAAGLIPSPLWVVLFFTAVIIFVFLLFFADSGERGGRPGAADGQRRERHRGHAAAVAVPRRSVPYGRRRAAAGGDGADRADHQPGARRGRAGPQPALRRVGRRAVAVSQPSEDVGRRRPWVEVVSTVLLALAAVATAWSSYQANRWNGEQAKAFSRGNALRIEASRAAGLAESQTEVDVATFIQWVDATATDEAELAEFYLDRFRAEFRPAFDAWMATDPFTDPEAPPTPFAMDDYRLEATAEAERLDAAAEESSAIARRNVQRSANYVLAVVLFAVALFFAGMSTKVPSPGARVAMVIMGCIVFLGAAAWIASFPISFAV